jgi:hypothetical protein
MMQTTPARAPWIRRVLIVLGAAALALPVTGAVAAMGRAAFSDEAPSPAILVNVPIASAGAVTGGVRGATLVLHDSLFGRSGQLRVRLMSVGEAASTPGFARTFGDDVLRQPAILGLATADDPDAFSFVTLHPWAEKRGSYVGNYLVGYWPGERGLVSRKYDNPVGFIEVNRRDLGVQLSTHFQLGDFVTHDQPNVWPKYVVLREALLDKLELVLAALEEAGVPAGHARVLSGFRTPHHNASVGEGAAYASRHQYGDAADLIIDDDRDGRMDDLNGDGRVNARDTDVILGAVERVERRWPELVGGLGLYAATGPSGPFAHIDVRGDRARWTNHGGATKAKTVTARRASTPGSGSSASRASGACTAASEFAALCGAR